MKQLPDGTFSRFPSIYPRVRALDLEPRMIIRGYVVPVVEAESPFSALVNSVNGEMEYRISEPAI